jgi:hypothetical protein
MEVEAQSRVLKALHVFTIPKREDGQNEDRWSASADDRIFALSDGASVSFDSGPWAQLLADRFVQNPDITCDWVQSAALEVRTRYNRDAMPWMQQAAYDQGSFATLLGLELTQDASAARVFAVGDSLLAFVDGVELVRTIPLIHPDDFDRSPSLISTNPAENIYLDADALANASTQIHLASHEHPFLLLMSDALGRWLLEGPQDRASTLLTIGSENEFVDFVKCEREAGRLKRDDTTMIVIGVAS